MFIEPQMPQMEPDMQPTVILNFLADSRRYLAS